MELGEITWGRGVPKKEERFRSCGGCGSAEEELASASGRRSQGESRGAKSVLYRKPAEERN